ncbi:MAG: BNR-4 repeat-containing protein [Synoicihabitans sp.]
MLRFFLGGVGLATMLAAEPAVIPADLGYRGIWFELNQKYEYGDKYSGGLGTYTAKHRPLAIHAPEVGMTFFVYGGTTNAAEKHLLCMIGAYDHTTDEIVRPTVVHDKEGVDDPHDNPSLLIDEAGYLWVFVSGRGKARPGFKYRSEQPYDISSFARVTEEEMTYPQPWNLAGGGMLHFFTKYTGVRELYFETSPDGFTWSDDLKLAGIREEGHSRGGHYQVSSTHGTKVGTFFNRHPDGVVDQRTDLYYLESADGGESWTTAGGEAVSIPVEDLASPTRAENYAALGKNVYLKDMAFDASGHPICLYVTSGGHEPGPMNAPREFKITRWDGARWVTHSVAPTGHNYDMGSLYLEDDRWTVIVPTGEGPQRHGTGGEIVRYSSADQGKNWQLEQRITRDSPRNHGYVRRPENAVDPFWYFWADGNPDTLSISRLYIGDSTGRYRALPVVMAESRMKLGLR